MANGVGVSDQERMDSSRHSNMEDSATYEERDTESEMNKFVALWMKVPTPEKPAKYLKPMPVQEKPIIEVTSQEL